MAARSERIRRIAYRYVAHAVRTFVRPSVINQLRISEQDKRDLVIEVERIAASLEAAGAVPETQEARHG